MTSLIILAQCIKFYHLHDYTMLTGRASRYVTLLEHSFKTKVATKLELELKCTNGFSS